MPPRKGGKSAQYGRHKRQATEFGQLDTTPTSRHLKSPDKGQPRQSGSTSQYPRTKGTQAPFQQKSFSIDEFDDGVDDVDLIKLATTEEAKTQPAHDNDFSWSETDSQARRSSPVQEESPEDIWEFENQASLRDPFSSPKSGLGKLPNTQPLPSQPANDPQPEASKQSLAGVDFSETASTARRSSPYVSQAATSQVAIEESWELEENNPLNLPSTIPDSAPLPKMTPFPQDVAREHLPADELYDATPPRGTGQPPAASPSMQSEPIHAIPMPRYDPTPPGTTQTTQAQSRSLRLPKRSLTEILEDELGPVEKEVSTPAPEKSHPRGSHTKAEKKKYSQAKPLSREKQASPMAQDESTAASGPKGRKRKQRAKTPIQFDDATQEVKEVPRPQEVAEAKKMPVVTALKKSSAAASSPTTNTRKKAAPKTTRKAAPRPAAKAAPKPTARKEPPLKKRKTTSQEEIEDKPPIIVKIAEIVDPSPAKNTRTKAARAKAKTAPEIEALENQRSRKVTNEPHGSTQDPIVVSSDPDSSLSSEDDFVPAEPQQPPETTHSLTQQSTIESDVGMSETSPVSFRYEEEQRVEVLPQRSASSRSPRPAHPAKVPFQTTKRGHSSMVDHSLALSARDPNIIAKRGPRDAWETGVSKKDVPMKWVETGSAQPARQASKGTRKFSISQAGSPMPLETGHAPSIGGSSLHNDETPRFARDERSGRQQTGPRRSQRLRGHAD
ncbi:hypothetical protein FALBO_6224 [Fusarium albosuccineum]|uniref:Uncharacterized protein n=1 Tax=Fusarium albosuccineum TaxID=1237068 RepID=A0A8H4LFA9_9HYPO|nr:hypothetical protein FALBO_6224 [Fusarium albosuccineum]